MGKRTLFLPLALLLALGAIAGLKTKIDALPRAKTPGAGIVYLPSGPAVKAATFGYPSLAADLAYVWAIQYYGDQKIPDRRTHFDRIFSVIADLDPKWVDPYLTAALIAHYDFKDPELALKMYDDGAARNPDEWIFPFEAGHYCQIALKDYERAKSYYAKAMAIPGAPDIARRLFANAAYKTMDYETSWQVWREVYEQATDPEIKKIASNHLYNIKATVDIAGLKAAVGEFRKARGRNPRELDELVSARIIAQVPVDFDGKDYLYDPATGDIKTAVIPWKR
jgi:tetratricopeptide (TPR) repeat protein